MANLAPVPDGLTGEEVLMCPDIMPTGFGGAESGNIRIGGTVAIFAQEPIGLCATAGARLKGAASIIVVDSVPVRLATARRLGADHLIDFNKVDPGAEIGEFRIVLEKAPNARTVGLSGLALCLVRLSSLAVRHRAIRELDINPLLINKKGMIALDTWFKFEDPVKHPAPPPAIRPYPAQWETKQPPRDGREMFIRPIRPDDERFCADNGVHRARAGSGRCIGAARRRAVLRRSGL